MKVYLAGTCNGSTWRDELIPLLDEAGIDYFNPIGMGNDSQVACDVCLYTITPRMTDSFAITEIVEDAVQRSGKTIFNVLPGDGDEDVRFNSEQIDLLIQAGKQIAESGGIFVSGLDVVMTALQTMDHLVETTPEVVTETVPGVVNKTLKNSDISGAKKNVKDIQVVGVGDLFRLISKAYSEKEGWMKSTKAMEVKDLGCLVQVTTQQRNPDGSYAVAEALAFVPEAKVVRDSEGDRRLVRSYQ
jgi:hypothetical protein